MKLLKNLNLNSSSDIDKILDWGKSILENLNF